MIKIGLIGIGNISKKHIAAIEKCEELSFTGVFDIDKEKAQEFCNKYSIKMFSSLSKIISENDILSVLTPHNTHVDVINEITKKNKICICEKPLCIYEKELNVLTKDQKKKIFVISQNRYNEAIEIVKNKLDNFELGKINFIQANTFWHRDPEYYQKSPWRGSVSKEGGILYNQGIHIIDIILYLLNTTSKESKIIFCKKYNFEQTVKNTESLFKAIIEINGIFIDLFVTTKFSKENYENSILISGEEKSIKISGNHLNNIIYPLQDEFIESSDDIYGKSHLENYKEIIKYVTTGKGNIITFNEALDRVKLLERLYKKIKNQ